MSFIYMKHFHGNSAKWEAETAAMSKITIYIYCMLSIITDIQKILGTTASNPCKADKTTLLRLQNIDNVRSAPTSFFPAW